MKRTRIHLKPAEAEELGFLNCSQLKTMGLMPVLSTPVAGTVWQGRGSYAVYRPSDCQPWKWEPTAAELRRREVAAEALKLVNQSPSACVMDTETTGVGSGDQICEIAIVDIDGRPLLNTLVKPTEPIPEETSAFNGITNAMLTNAPSWAEVAEEFATVIAGRTVVTYNASFDARLVQQTQAKYGVLAPQMDITCAMLLYARWNGEWNSVKGCWRWKKLEIAAKECGSHMPGAHRALADSMMALGVLRYLALQRSGRRRKPKTTDSTS